MLRFILSYLFCLALVSGAVWAQPINVVLNGRVYCRAES